eukprot:13393683-Alexandrium_andersonii.AAC.1
MPARDTWEHARTSLTDTRAFASFCSARAQQTHIIDMRQRSSRALVSASAASAFFLRVCAASRRRGTRRAKMATGGRRQPRSAWGAEEATEGST